MPEGPDQLRSLAEQVLTSAREAAFALMKANYSERDAPYLGAGQKIQGLEPQARDIAVRLRESIWYRFDALRFHHGLLKRLHDGYTRALVEAGPIGVRDRGIDTASNAALREQMLFDSIVFHAISLYDYLGNAVWFGFHGSNFLKKKWKNVVRAARDPEFERKTTRGTVRLNGSMTGDLLLAVHDEFVGQLAGYRAKLFHYHVDSAGGGVTQTFKSIPGEEGRTDWTPELRITLPKEYVQSVRGLTAQNTEEGTENLLVSGAETLIIRVGETTLEILQTLVADLGWDKTQGLTILS